MNGIIRTAAAAGLMAVSFQVSAVTFATDFLNSLSRDYMPISVARYEQTASRIYLAEPSLLQQWGLFSTDAEASYNGALRTIVLKPENLTRSVDGKKSIADTKTLRARHGYVLPVRAATVIHELAHAELGRVVSRRETAADSRLARLIADEVKPWFARNSKSHLPWWPGLAVSEWFAYFRGDLVKFYFDELVELLAYNGISFFEPQKCLTRKSVTWPDDRFHVPPGNQTSYRELSRVSWIWVQGTDLELKGTGADPFRPEWHDALWDHFEQIFRPARSRGEFVDWLNRHPAWRGQLKTCRDRR